MCGMSGATGVIAPQVRDLDRRCAGCGYELRGLDANRCPECGLTFDRTIVSADVPWLATGGRGDIEAYVATVALVLTRPRQFGAQVWRSVEVDAWRTRRFRKVTV